MSSLLPSELSACLVMAKEAIYELPAFPELSACIGLPVYPVMNMEVIPLSEALPLMGVAILCVWATHITTASPQKL